MEKGKWPTILLADFSQGTGERTRLKFSPVIPARTNRGIQLDGPCFGSPLQKQQCSEVVVIRFAALGWSTF